MEMKTTKNLGFVLAGMALLALALISPGSAAPAPSVQQVKIVDPLASGMVSVNVGNTPSVNVASLPTVNAAQSGVWMVDVNGVALMRDVDNPARQPFRGNFGLGMVDSQASHQQDFTVPVGKRLVVEFASGMCQLPTGQKCRFVVTDSLSGVNIELVSNAQGSFAGADVFVAAQTLRHYVEPEANLIVYVSRDPATGTGAARMDVIGYYVDVP